MEYQRIHAPEEGTAKIFCPRCFNQWDASSKKLRGKHRFQVKCKCDWVFWVEFDIREKHRRQTELDAFVELVEKPEKWGKITSDSATTTPQSANSKISDISSIGIGITLFNDIKFKKGDRIKIEFTLYDSELSRIEKKAIVKRVEDNYIGCEFFAADKYDKRLRFYVL